jgi:hypothetical protein
LDSNKNGFDPDLNQSVMTTTSKGLLTVTTVFVVATVDRVVVDARVVTSTGHLTGGAVTPVRLRHSEATATVRYAFESDYFSATEINFGQY